MADVYSYAKTNMAGYNNNLNSRLIPSANLTDDGLGIIWIIFKGSNQ